MSRRTVSMQELLETYERADRCGFMQDNGARRLRLEAAVATGRIVMLDQVMQHDPEEALLMALVGSSCGHLIRLPITVADMAVIVGFARSEGVIV